MCLSVKLKLMWYFKRELDVLDVSVRLSLSLSTFYFMNCCWCSYIHCFTCHPQNACYTNPQVHLFSSRLELNPTSDFYILVISDAKMLNMAPLKLPPAFLCLYFDVVNRTTSWLLKYYVSPQDFHFSFLLLLTLPRSCCSSTWISMSLLLNSSLVACTESVIPSGFSGFLPFLKGGPAGGVVDDIALWSPNQDEHRAPGVVKRRRESVAAPPPCEHHHHYLAVKPTSLLEVAESFY